MELTDNHKRMLYALSTLLVALAIYFFYTTTKDRLLAILIYLVGSYMGYYRKKQGKGAKHG